MVAVLFFEPPWEVVPEMGTAIWRDFDVATDIINCVPVNRRLYKSANATIFGLCDYQKLACSQLVDMVP